MAEGSGKAREISLGEDFGDVAVKVNGVRVWEAFDITVREIGRSVCNPSMKRKS